VQGSGVGFGFCGVEEQLVVIATAAPARLGGLRQAAVVAQLGGGHRPVQRRLWFTWGGVRAGGQQEDKWQGEDFEMSHGDVLQGLREWAAILRIYDSRCSVCMTFCEPNRFIGTRWYLKALIGRFMLIGKKLIHNGHAKVAHNRHRWSPGLRLTQMPDFAGLQ